jgi:hypothetical protein
LSTEPMYRIAENRIYTIWHEWCVSYRFWRSDERPPIDLIVDVGFDSRHLPLRLMAAALRFRANYVRPYAPECWRRDNVDDVTVSDFVRSNPWWVRTIARMMHGHHAIIVGTEKFYTHSTRRLLAEALLPYFPNCSLIELTQRDAETILAADSVSISR